MRAVQFRIAKNQRRQDIARAFFVAVCVVLSASSAVARTKRIQEAPVSLTAAGEKLQAQYAAALTALQAEISKALPKIDVQKKAAFLKALEAEKAAAEANAKQEALKTNQGGAAAEEKAKKSVADAGKAEADAREKVKQAAVAKYAAQEDAAILADAPYRAPAYQVYCERQEGF